MAEVWTVQKILNWTCTTFSQKSITNARLDAELLLANVLNCNRLELYLQFERILSVQERNRFRGYVQRRMRREPVHYILGEVEFRGLTFQVTPDVLIPRPETELLVTAVLETIAEAHLDHPKILDIGTGSGCIAVSLAREIPSAEVWALDYSSAVLNIARKNAQAHRTEIRFVQQDIFRPLSEEMPLFDIVVSNPPYVTAAEESSLQPEVKDYEPHSALFASGDGLDFYRQFLAIAPQILVPEGAFVLEMGYDKATRVAGLFKKQEFNTEIKKDYSQIERIIIVRRKEEFRKNERLLS